MKTDLTVEFVRSILDYDPETGIFRWRDYWKSVVPGRVAGRVCGNGYGSISIKGKHRSSHRLAWLHYYGEWPDCQIDHINRDRADNRIANLRVVTGSQNCLNRAYVGSRARSGTKGITFRSDTQRWQAQICIPGTRKVKYLGVFKTEQGAKDAYLAAKALEL